MTASLFHCIVLLLLVVCVMSCRTNTGRSSNNRIFSLSGAIFSETDLCLMEKLSADFNRPISWVFFPVGGMVVEQNKEMIALFCWKSTDVEGHANLKSATMQEIRWHLTLLWSRVTAE